MRAVTGMAFLGLVLVGIGCDGPNGPTPVGVSGTVQLDKKPMAEGEIVFSVAGEVPATMEIKEGAFEGKSLPGKAKVEVRQYKMVKQKVTMPGAAPDSVKQNMLPARYNTATTLSADVTKDGANKFEFSVESK